MYNLSEQKRGQDAVDKSRHSGWGVNGLQNTIVGVLPETCPSTKIKPYADHAI